MNFTDPKNIKVRDGLDRYRKDLKDLTKLADSIKLYGQLAPIIITKDFELVAGGRRLAACILAGVNVSYIFKDIINDTHLRELEIEENIVRAEFTPAELSLAIADLHRLKQSTVGKSVKGSPNTGWTVQNTADLLGYSQGAISQQLLIAETVTAFPELRNCKSAVEIRQAVKGLQKKMERERLIADMEKTGTLDISSVFYCGDFKQWLSTLNSNSADVLITDPPYGIDIGNIMCTSGGKTGGFSNQGFKYDDSPDISIYKTLAVEATRVCKKDTAFAIVFISMDFFPLLRQHFMLNGWDVSVRPLVWVKPGSSSNAPKVWPVSSYEIAMFARRPQAYLNQEGFRDVITDINPVHYSYKKHPSEKPIDLFRKLLQVVGKPGQTIIDPFCGSGATLIAGIREKMIVKGCDILPECTAIIKERLLLENFTQ